MIGSEHWIGGISYTELLIRAMRFVPADKQPVLILLVYGTELKQLNYYKYIIDEFDAILCIGQFEYEWNEVSTDLNLYKVATEREAHQFIDVIFPVPFDIRHDFLSISWIPDLQHRYLPNLFSSEEVKKRDDKLRAIARFARTIVFSSKNAVEDFSSFYPDSKAEKMVLRFYSLPREDCFKINPTKTIEKYGISNPFIICCNQIWAHKNHRLLFESIALLKDQGVIVNLVCTGSTVDYRNPSYFKSLNEYLRILGIQDQVRFLGLIPREDQIQLMRGSVFLVQPSLFEGWSTVVEDGRSLGVRMLLSDLDVHKEQNPPYSYFFDRSNAGDLADKIKIMLREVPVERVIREKEALVRSEFLVTEYANNFIDVVTRTIEKHTEQKLLQHHYKVNIVIRSSLGVIDPDTLKSIQSQINIVTSITIGPVVAEESDFIFFMHDGYILEPTLMQSMAEYTADSGEAIQVDLNLLDVSGHKIGAVSSNTSLYDSLFEKNGVFLSRNSYQKIISGEKSGIVSTPIFALKINMSKHLEILLQGKQKVLIYGGGGHTEMLIKQLLPTRIEIVGILDQKPQEASLRFPEREILLPSERSRINYDAIIISSLSYEDEIYRELILTEDPDKIVRIYKS